MKLTIKINIVNKRPMVIGAPVIVCGNSDYTIEFTFDDEWTSATLKTARFLYVQAGVAKYQDLIFTGSVVSVPVLSEVSEVMIGVYAGDLRTSTPARIPCERSILCGTGVEYEAPDPDVYNQIMVEVNTLVSQAINHQIVVSDVEPTLHPTLWFNTAKDGEASHAVTLNLTEDESGSEVQAGVNGENYGVENTTLNKGATESNYDLEVL